MNFPINHDLHNHTSLSACCKDAKLTGEYTADFANQSGYTSLCITDHVWDSAVPGNSAWYAPQDIAHIKQILPLPTGGECKLMFGCETEYCGKGKLGLAPDNFGEFDMIVIPPNHFHMIDFVRPAEYNTEEKVAELFAERLEELAQMSLPWKKIGIAHLNCGLVFDKEKYTRVFELMDERRTRIVLREFARLGAGIELNAACFPDNWRQQENAHLRLFRLAAEEGCKFYCASDAHTRDALDKVSQRLSLVAELLSLTSGDLFIPQNLQHDLR